MTFDVVDLRLLRAMGMLPFAAGARGPDALKASRLAEIVGLTPQSVKDRLARLEADRVVVGYPTHVNLRHLGLELTTFHYPLPEERKARFLRDIEPMDGFAGSANFLGPDVCIDIHYRDEQELARRLRLVETLAGVSSHPVFFHREMPPVAQELTPLDWRIVKALRPDARRSAEDVAADIGVTARTVRNRIERMVKGNSLDVTAAVDPSRLPGAIPVGLILHLAHPTREIMQAVLKALDEHYVYWWIPRSPEVGHFDLSLLAWTPAQVEELRQRAAEVPGVVRARAIIPCGMSARNWLDDAIERRVREATA